MVEPEHISIVGVGRSGTTLLMSILNAHSSIAIPPEFHFVRRYLARHAYLEHGQFLTALKDDPFFGRLGLDPTRVTGEREAPHEHVELATVYHRILAQYGKDRNAAYVGDKDPKNIEHLPIIAHVFPGAYLVHVIRDPRDVYLSRTRADWAKGRNRTAHLLAYRAQFVAGRQGADLFGDRYIEVYYEQLLADPERVLFDLCTRLRLPFEPTMLDYTASARELVADDELQWKGSALKPLQKDNAGKWKGAGMSRNLVLTIEAACRPVFQTPIYKESVRPSGLVEHVVRFGWDKTIGFLAALYNWRLRTSGRRIVTQMEANRHNSSPRPV
ncbi:MAG: sulfotransferase, partial [Rhodothermia bacterium]